MSSSLPSTSAPTSATGLPAALNTDARFGTVWPLHNFVVVALLLLTLQQVLVPAFSETTFGIEVHGVTGVTIRDFAAHRTYAHAFWTTGADYSVADHVRITNRWAGQPVGRALPFGYSPTMLWLLGPLSALPVRWAFVAWCMLSGLAVWWMTRQRRTIPIVGAVILLSPLGLICFALGQTAILTAAAIICLALRQWNRQNTGGQIVESWSWSLAPDVLLLWALTAKPPLAVVAGIALLATKQWRTVVTAVGLTAVTTALLTPQLGAHWWAHYLQMMAHYDRDTAGAVYSWSLRPDHMSNLRSMFAWAGIFSDSVACRISSIAWLAAMVAIVGAGLKGKLQLASVWALGTLAYLLLCPHVTSTEELHLVVLVALVAAGSRITTPGWAIVALVLVVAFLPPAGFLPVGSLRSGLIFGAKLILVGLALSSATWSRRTTLLWGGLPTATPRPTAGLQ